MKRFKHVLTIALLAAPLALVLAMMPQAAEAEPVIVIGNPNVQPMPIAIPDFPGGGGDSGQVGLDISKVVSDDLERSGLFAPINHQAFIQAQVPTSVLPQYQNWRVLNAQALVSGDVQVTANGQLQVNYRLWDVFGETQMDGNSFTAPASSWRRIAHIVADAIYKRITGEEGYFDTRIVYVSETGPKDRRVKRLAIMDQDGENHKYLTQGDSLVLTPRFSPASQDITYMSFYNNKPRVYLFNINTGQQEILGDFPGMTFAPRFSPDGSKVILSMAKDGNTDIWTMDTRTRRAQRITDAAAIDTSPCYSPDGNRIVFNSDRGGEQQIYVMNADGSGVQRISKGPGRYATPVWSPRGDLIAFTRLYQGGFYIGVMRPDGSGERQLASGWLVEGPTWAPNGRVLAFFESDPSGKTLLHSIDLTGANERVMKTPMDGSDPAWGPLLSNQ